MRDSIHNTAYRVAIAPEVSTNNTAIVGNWIDTAGFNSLGFSIFTGAVAGTPTFTLVMDEADAADYSDHANVADGDMLAQTEGDVPETDVGTSISQANGVAKIGYIGNKRYVRISVTPASNTSAALAAIAALSHASVRPVA